MSTGQMPAAHREDRHPWPRECNLPVNCAQSPRLLVRPWSLTYRSRTQHHWLWSALKRFHLSVELPKTIANPGLAFGPEWMLTFPEIVPASTPLRCRHPSQESWCVKADAQDQAAHNHS